MDTHTLKVKSVEHATHNVLRIRTEKPQHYIFVSGQATELSINKPEWKDKKRPFTFTSLPPDDYLEFTIKVYVNHQGVTNELLNLKEGDELIIGDSWGNIEYKGEGVFLAGGAGVTPFISIFRNLYSQHKLRTNKLIFANDKEEDIINKKEFENILGKNFINILSQEKLDKYEYGFITEAFLKGIVSDFSQYFYLCGPPAMMKAIGKMLVDLNVDPNKIVKEK